MRKKGFTLIELLVVISIIALIIGIMSPGIRKTKQAAEKLKQRSQLRNIEMGVEQWYNENNFQYPDSETKFGGSYTTTGSQHLTEALVGRDCHGFDKTSTWNAENDEADNTIYEVGNNNYHHRQMLYVDINDNPVAQIAQIYSTAALAVGNMSPYPGDKDDNAVSTGHSIASVFTDIFTRKRVLTPEGKSIRVGMPILYYKAKDTDTFDSLEPASSIFNYQDNERVMMLGNNMDFAGEQHPFYANGNGFVALAQQPAIDKFYDWLINPVIRYGKTPYNMDSFLLLSAGHDGLYGTNDDVHNISNKR